jgi:hypothetical protein
VIAASAPAQEPDAEQRKGEVYALVDNLSVRAGPAIWAAGVRGELKEEEPMEEPGLELLPAADELQCGRWARGPRVRMIPLAPTSDLRPQPMILHPRPEASRELPPLRATPPYVSYAFGLVPPLRSERLDDLVNNNPIDPRLPSGPALPGVGSGLPPGSPVPEPTGAAVMFGLIAWTLSQRPRR